MKIKKIYNKWTDSSGTSVLYVVFEDDSEMLAADYRVIQLSPPSPNSSENQD